MNYKDKISELLKDYRCFWIKDVSNSLNRKKVKKYLKRLEKEKVIMTLGKGENTTYLSYSPMMIKLLNR